MGENLGAKWKKYKLNMTMAYYYNIIYTVLYILYIYIILLLL